jgi:hypothetical protein
MALATGILWSFIWRVLFFSLFNIILAAGAGYAVGEVISLSVNRKRGLGLQIIAGVAVFLSYGVRNIFLVGSLGGGLLLSLSLFSIFQLIALGLGIFIAVTRLR